MKSVTAYPCQLREIWLDVIISGWSDVSTLLGTGRPMPTLENTLELLHLLGDETRVRLLALVEREELTVAELTSILELSQSRVSTHLGHLKQAGLVSDRKAGVASFYTMNTLSDPAKSLWQLVSASGTDRTLE